MLRNITYLKNGISNVAFNDPLAKYPALDPSQNVCFFDDFLTYDVTQADMKYLFTQTNCVDSIVGPKGSLVLTLGGADNDLGQLQFVNTPFQTDSKKLWFKTRVKVTLDSGGDMDNYEMLFGLTSNQQGAAFVANDGSAYTYDDGIAFRSIDGTSELTCAMGENDTETTVADVFDVVDDTWMELAIYYDGAKATFYKDGLPVASISTNDAVSVLTPCLYLKAGEAKATTLSCDYILVAAER